MKKEYINLQIYETEYSSCSWLQVKIIKNEEIFIHNKKLFHGLYLTRQIANYSLFS